MATETRVMTMGNVNHIVKDDANIKLFPSTINYYPNIFVGEIGDDFNGPTKDDYDEMCEVGVHWQFGADSDNPWVLGLYFSDEEYYHWILDKTEEDADHRIDLYYGRKLSDMPFVAYHNMDMQDLDIEMGFPVANRLSGKGDIKLINIPGGKHAFCMYLGAYSGLEPVYREMAEWIQKNGYEATGDAYEHYYNGPGRPENELLTKIVMPLK